MAEEPGVGKFHEVDNAEAGAVIEYCSRAIPHNEMLGRLVRNMYKRIQALEAENKELRAKKSDKRVSKKAVPQSGGP